MKGVKREIKVFSVLNKIKQKSKIKDSSQKIKNVPERIGDRLDALETKIEEILNRLKWTKLLLIKKRNVVGVLASTIMVLAGFGSMGKE